MKVQSLLQHVHHASAKAVHSTEDSAGSGYGGDYGSAIPYGSGSGSGYGGDYGSATPYGSGSGSGYGGDYGSATPYGSGAGSGYGGDYGSATPYGSGSGSAYGSAESVSCDWQTEETCYDDNWNPESCASISGGGCPCAAGEQKCGMMDDYAGWCSAEACPLSCDWQTEEACYDDNWNTESCHLISDGGCPCSAGEQKCGMQDNYAGWCSAEVCPLSCDWQTEEACYDDNWNTESCHSISDGGCPCAAGEQKCGMMYDYAGWCSAEACPLSCDWKTEETCYDDNWNAESCTSISDGGCPCAAGEQKCGMMDDWAGWCSAEACPLSCDWQTEETCYDASWTVTSCAPKSEGCPSSLLAHHAAHSGSGKLAGKGKGKIKASSKNDGKGSTKVKSKGKAKQIEDKVWTQGKSKGKGGSERASGKGKGKSRVKGKSSTTPKY